MLENGILSVLLLKYTFLHIRGLHSLDFYLKKALNTQTAQKATPHNFFTIFHFVLPYFHLPCIFALLTKHIAMMILLMFWKLYIHRKKMDENNRLLGMLLVRHSEKLKAIFLAQQDFF